MFGLRSAQGRATAAILVLLVLLGSVAAAEAWRAQKDQTMRDSLGHRSAVVAAFEKARSEYFRSATLMTAAVFAEDATPFVDSWRQAVAEGDQQLLGTQDALTELGDKDTLAALNSVTEQMRQQAEQVEEIVDFAATADVSTRIGVGQQQFPLVWDGIQAQLAELDGLANEQEAKLTAERAAADSSAEVTVALVLALSAFAFLAGAATLSGLLMSVVRPLSSLQASVKAITSGNWSVRAKVFGLEETASLAHDFNEMTDTLVERSAQLQESEQRFRNVLDVSRDFIYKVDLRTGAYAYASPSVLQLTGFTPEEVVAMGLGGVAERIHPEDSSRLTGEIKDLTKDWNEGQRSAISVYRWKCKNGEYRWFSDNSAFTRYSNEQPATLIGAIRDITVQKQAEEALRESEERYRSIFESIQDVFYRTDGEGIITEISPSVERFGYTREQLVGTQVLEVYGDPEERSGLLKAVLEQGEVTDHEIQLKTGDGRLVSTSVSAHILRGPDGTLSGVEGTLRDISDRKAAEEAVLEQARRDPLTGVLNHGGIVDEMRSLISDGELAAVWAVAMVDVNGLKVANDTYGHQVGDAVLVAVAVALSRDDAVVGRYGGDEFVAILPSADRNSAEYYLNKVMDALAHVTVSDPETGATISVGASIGLALYPEDGRTIADLIKFSDAAMYAAKRQRPFRRPSPHKPRIDRKAA